MKEKSQPVDEAPELVQVSEETPSRTEGGRFPIVGIGASAGGLEALEQFVGRVPAISGMAFVIVQHLDPTSKGIMPELLQRVTTLPVRQVTDLLRIQPDCVYVIPPNKDMCILHGVLHLLEPAAPRGLRLPIDFFLRSLAEDQQERSIGVILSGMGTDGTLGLRAIKEKAGLVLVQDPASAKFDGMPRSAIDAGLADIVAKAPELPEKIVAFLQHAPLVAARTGPVLEGQVQSALEKIVILLRLHTGNDFSLYKKSTVYRRIERRMSIHQIHKIAAYVRYLQENPQELGLLFRELLIGVTSFFRDPAAWTQLKEQAIPALLAGRPAGGPLRAWAAGCSTGEEAYSLAMVLQEALEEARPPRRFALQIFATDLDRDAIEKARGGVYPANIAADVPPARLSRFFLREEGGGYRVVKEIRELVIFAPQNLVMDPPFTRLDLLSCRNLLIYLTPEIQKKLLPLFHYSLNPGGLLFLGSAETVGGSSDVFTPLDIKSRLFRRRESALVAEQLEFPPSFVPALPGVPEAFRAPKPVVSLQSLADHVLLQRFAPAAVLASDKGDILYISGRTGKYLEPAAGKANWNIFAMAREGLRYELTSAFQKAVRQGHEVTLRGLRVATDGGEQAADLTIQPVDAPEALRGTVMIAFAEVAAPPAAKAPGRAGSAQAQDAQPAELLQEIQRVRAELRTTREEMQSSQEELRSTNEELQSTNEELQSANQELTSTKKELQSLNEELHTVNAELQSKVDELVHANNDMKNLLDSTDIAIVFLDNNLHVRRFTTQATRIIKLIPGDVGRPITDIASDLLYPALPEDVREVLRTLVFIEKPVATRRGSWFAVRIMPYRTQESRIDGVVITLTDITAAKKLEAELRETGSFYRALFETMPAGVLFQNTAGTVAFANPAAEHILGLTLERIQRQPPGDARWQTVHEDGSPFPAETHPAMVALKTDRPVHNAVMGLCSPSSGQRVWISVSATPFFRAGEDKPSQVFAVFHDITGQKKG